MQVVVVGAVGCGLAIEWQAMQGPIKEHLAAAHWHAGRQLLEGEEREAQHDQRAALVATVGHLGVVVVVVVVEVMQSAISGLLKDWLHKKLTQDATEWLAAAAMM
ncbi:UNVERIFIED_CONTAM: hypothetical protein K2H54_053023 [Gekko kuhli]